MGPSTSGEGQGGERGCRRGEEGEGLGCVGEGGLDPSWHWPRRLWWGWVPTPLASVSLAGVAADTAGRKFHRVYSFLDYIMGGCQIHFTVSPWPRLSPACPPSPPPPPPPPPPHPHPRPYPTPTPVPAPADHPEKEPGQISGVPQLLRVPSLGGERSLAVLVSRCLYVRLLGVPPFVQARKQAWGSRSSPNPPWEVTSPGLTFHKHI